MHYMQGVFAGGIYLANSQIQNILVSQLQPAMFCPDF
jgi:hypothetical protein